jgi:hypothetical protein
MFNHAQIVRTPIQVMDRLLLVSQLILHDFYGGLYVSPCIYPAVDQSLLIPFKVGPFWYPHMIASCGLKGSAGLVSGLIVIFSILPVIFLQVRRLGARNRAASI